MRKVLYPQDHLPPTKKQIELHNIRKVFKKIGGWREMAVWAEKNRDDFYTKIYARLLRPDTEDDTPLPEGGNSIIIIEGVDPIPRTTDGKIDEAALYDLVIGRDNDP